MGPEDMGVGRTWRLANQSEALLVSWGAWWPGLPRGQAEGMGRRDGSELRF